MTSLPADLDQSLQDLLGRCNRQSLIGDFREYLSTGHINAELRRRLDEDQECRRAMDILFSAQADAIRQVSHGLLPTGRLLE